MSGYFDRNGKPMELMEWARAFEDGAGRVVERTELPGDVSVSTVWLGLDHQFGAGPPLIFETMVFGGDLDGEQERYSTEAEARTGHAAMVARVGRLRVSQGGVAP